MYLKWIFINNFSVDFEFCLAFKVPQVKYKLILDF